MSYSFEIENKSQAETNMNGLLIVTIADQLSDFIKIKEVHGENNLSFDSYKYGQTNFFHHSQSGQRAVRIKGKKKLS